MRETGGETLNCGCGRNRSVREGIWGGETNINGHLSSNMETYFISLLKYTHILRTCESPAKGQTILHIFTLVLEVLLSMCCFY